LQREKLSITSSAGSSLPVAVSWRLWAPRFLSVPLFLPASA
jgi:hypothetical protein